MILGNSNKENYEEKYYDTNGIELIKEIDDIKRNFFETEKKDINDEAVKSFFDSFVFKTFKPKLIIFFINIILDFLKIIYIKYNNCNNCNNQENCQQRQEDFIKFMKKNKNYLLSEMPSNNGGITIVQYLLSCKDNNVKTDKPKLTCKINDEYIIDGKNNEKIKIDIVKYLIPIKKFIENNDKVLKNFKCLFKDNYDSKNLLDKSMNDYIDDCKNEIFKITQEDNCENNTVKGGKKMFKKNKTKNRKSRKQKNIKRSKKRYLKI